MFNQWPYSYLPPLSTIHSASIESTGLTSGLNVGSGYISAVYSTANRIFFVPFHIEVPIIVTKLFWCNGTAVSGNCDIGIYSADMTRIVSAGSTAQATISVLQEVDITDTAIGPGDFYLAFACDNITATILRGSPTATAMRRMGCLQNDAGTVVLPATGSPISPTVSYLPLIGLRQGGTQL